MLRAVWIKISMKGLLGKPEELVPVFLQILGFDLTGDEMSMNAFLCFKNRYHVQLTPNIQRVCSKLQSLMKFDKRIHQDTEDF